MKTTLLITALALAPALQAQTPTASSLVANPDFATAGANGVPEGWMYTKAFFTDPREKKKERVPNGVTVESVLEGSRPFVRFGFADNQAGGLIQIVQLPPKAKKVEFSVSVRGVHSGGPGKPTAGVRFFNENGKFLPDRRQTKGPKDLSPHSWNDIEIECEVPQGATVCNVVVGVGDPTVGTYEFRDVSLRFR